MPMFHCSDCVTEDRDAVTLVLPGKLLPDSLEVDCPLCGGPLVREGGD